MKRILLLCLVCSSVFCQENKLVYHETCSKIYENAGNFKKAIFHYEQTAHYKAPGAVYYLSLAWLYRKNKEQEKAVQTFKEALKNGMSPEQYQFEVDSFLSTKEIAALHDEYYSTYYLPFLKRGNNILKEQFVLSCLAADQTAVCNGSP
jgi:tetratricopeptide (TPR) repeat protein